MQDKLSKIRSLNDRLRLEQTGGTILLTAGIEAKGREFSAELFARLVDVTFDADDNPYGEHDFGCIGVQASTVIFKIDFYDLNGTAASPNPADDELTLRVMTLMLAEEY